MVYVTGDMHGDISRFDSPAIKQLKKGDTLIICGDFGFIWDNSKAEQKILKKLMGKKFNICFVANCNGIEENAHNQCNGEVEGDGGKVVQHNVQALGNLFVVCAQIFE